MPPATSTDFIRSNSYDPDHSDVPNVYEGPRPHELAAIPDCLKARHQWVLWQAGDRVNTKTGEVCGIDKVPYTTDPDHKASTTDATTWAGYQSCVDALPTVLEDWRYHAPRTYRGGGIGFIFAANDPYCGIDLDHCRDSSTGKLTPWAQAIINAMQSYTQVSVSGTGLHILIAGKLPPGGRQNRDLQLWDSARFFAMTGQHLPGTPTTIHVRQAELETLWHAHFTPEPEQGNEPEPPEPASDAAILQKVRHAKNAARFTQLWSGNTATYPSESEADLALLNILAFYTPNTAQLARLFEGSTLADSKWMNRADYRQRTIRKAVSGLHHRYPWPQAPVPGPEPSEPGAYQELPKDVACPDAENPCQWHQDYIAHSQKWAPRAYEGFHPASGLWALSGTAAGRPVADLGGDVLPSLYIALVARTSLHTKSTSAKIAKKVMTQAGLWYLMAAGRATPQALLASMNQHLSPVYESLDDEAQQKEWFRLAFAGQKTWYADEFGSVIAGMMRADGGPMAEYRSLLRGLDDHEPELLSDTITRGREKVIEPYLALLASLTPADLRPFARRESTLWHDGFLARFAFCVPTDADISEAPFPREPMTIPTALVTGLHGWHTRLGIPKVNVIPPTTAAGKNKKGPYILEVDPLPKTRYTLSDEVFQAIYAYDSQLRALIRQRTDECLDGNYARFPTKALRVALLLASVDDTHRQHTIGMDHWRYAVRIAETWRRDLHRVVDVIDKPAPDNESPLARQERRILAVLEKKGALTIRGIHLATKIAYGEIKTICDTLVDLNILTRGEGKVEKFSLTI